MTLQFLLQVQVEGDGLIGDFVFATKVSAYARMLAIQHSRGKTPVVKMDSLPPAEVFDVNAALQDLRHPGQQP